MKTILPIIGLLFAFCTGCGTVYTGSPPGANGMATTVKTHAFGLFVEAWSAPSGNPRIILGSLFTEVHVTPISTNRMWAPPITDTSLSKSTWNPFDVGIGDTLGFGDVSINAGGTNGAQTSAVIPKLKPPVNPEVPPTKP